MEYDCPHILLTNTESLFSKLADATGPSNSQLIRKIAKSTYEQISNDRIAIISETTAT
jgi:hypothetical protein